jgi:nucleoside-diphosphate-sugar epimerase
MGTVKSKIPSETVFRMAVDAALLIASIGLALIISLFTVSIPEGVVHLVALRQRLLTRFLLNAPLLAVEGVSVFYLFGLYTRSRVYRGKYKLLFVVQAVVVAFLVENFTIYLINRFYAMPRRATLMSLAFAILFIVGVRVVKYALLSKFKIDKSRTTRKGAIRDVLVIGGAGYIGSMLCRQLLARGYNVRVLDLLIFGDDSIKQLYGHPCFEVLKGDFRNVASVARALKNVDAVVHLGGLVGDPACALDEQLTEDINTQSTRLIKEVCRGYGVNRLIYASSCSVYGRMDGLLDEGSTLNPVSLYARTKLMSEKILLDEKHPDFTPCILRFGTVFGLSMRPRFDLVVNLLAARAFFDAEITVSGPERWRPFVHVVDVARSCIQCLEAPERLVAYSIFNVGSTDQNYRLRELAEMVADVFPNTKVNIVDDVGDMRDYKVNCDKILNQLGLRCEKGVLGGLLELKQAFVQEKIRDYRDPLFSNVRFLERNHTRYSAAIESTDELTEAWS